MVLPSPNGVALSLQSKKLTICGCLRNAKAIAKKMNQLSANIGIIAAGERWSDDSLRPAIEDLLGAGAIISYLSAQKSAEATLITQTFQALSTQIEDLLMKSVSGQELIERGFAEDVFLASEINISSCVPV